MDTAFEKDLLKQEASLLARDVKKELKRNKVLFIIEKEIRRREGVHLR